MRRALFAASALGSIAVAQVFVGAGSSAATFPGDNGGRIAFVSDSPGDFDIFTMSPGGKGKRNLTNSPRIDSGPRWSPDGSKIVFPQRPRRPA